MGEPLKVGIVGAGAISGAYLKTFPALPGLQLTAIADLDPARAEAAASTQSDVAALTVGELIASDAVDAVLNLTIPAAHAEVALAAIAGGKHVYGEKPLAANKAEASGVLAAAASAGLRVGCAPDTVLGTGIQTARKAVDDGLIGRPVAATAFMVTPGHERWHPDPEFYYRPGGGPLLDMGPYYLTALVHLLGPVRRVVGLSSRPRETRTIGSGPKAGTSFGVEIDTHITGVLEHDSGALTTLVMSFDVWTGRLPRIEVYGSDGSLSAPDPNGFAGAVELWRPDDKEWVELPTSAGYADASRGYGLADLARGLAADRPHRASAEVAAHVLDVMESLLLAGQNGAAVEVASTCERPELVPAGVTPDAA
ncbi:MAG TPA: Gfo/Idh/MocA family oxidoreductase [Mycobacteriales bacterium]|nr:Gfo/Idh/MocA family oxidoreductase [Mycobacteriales bacterium]